MGLGNVLMHLCQVNTVSSAILKRGYTKYIDIKKEILEDDGRPDAQFHTYVMPDLHVRIRDIIEPTDITKSLVEKYWQDVAYGIQIRRGSLSSCASVARISDTHCDSKGLEKFHTVVNQVPGKFFLASDCRKTKQDFMEMYPDRVVTIDDEAEHSLEPNGHWLTFVEFFILSKCPIVFMTGGATDMLTFSTFGYMACMYGNKRYVPVFND